MRLPASRAPALSSLPFTFLFAHIYITQRHVLQKERRLTMKIPNTSETRIVSHTLRFKSCPANTKDQPKREAQVNKEQLKPQAHCISLTLSPTKALLLLLFFFFFFLLHLLLHVSPGPSFHVGFESIGLDPFFFILFFHQFSVARNHLLPIKQRQLILRHKIA